MAHYAQAGASAQAPCAPAAASATAQCAQAGALALGAQLEAVAAAAGVKRVVGSEAWLMASRSAHPRPVAWPLPLLDAPSESPEDELATPAVRSALLPAGSPRANAVRR
jgi:hypothetical protein